MSQSPMRTRSRRCCKPAPTSPICATHSDTKQKSTFYKLKTDTSFVFIVFAVKRENIILQLDRINVTELNINQSSTSTMAFWWTPRCGYVSLMRNWACHSVLLRRDMTCGLGIIVATNTQKNVWITRVQNPSFGISVWYILTFQVDRRMNLHSMIFPTRSTTFYMQLDRKVWVILDLVRALHRLLLHCQFIHN